MKSKLATLVLCAAFMAAVLFTTYFAVVRSVETVINRVVSGLEAEGLSVDGIIDTLTEKVAEKAVEYFFGQADK